MDRRITYKVSDNTERNCTFHNYSKKQIISALIERHVNRESVIKIEKPVLCKHCGNGYIWIQDIEFFTGEEYK